VWAEVPGTGWQPAVVRRVGRLRGERTPVTVAFEPGIPTLGTRTPPYLRPRNLRKRGKDKPGPRRRDRF
jgi:hypothetical protein